jgi:hypothetical protein
VKDTINAVRARLRMFDGSSHLSIDPRCQQLILDLRSAVVTENLDQHHALAWLRYFVQRQYPIQSPIITIAGHISFSV